MRLQVWKPAGRRKANRLPSEMLGGFSVLLQRPIERRDEDYGEKKPHPLRKNECKFSADEDKQENRNDAYD